MSGDLVQNLKRAGEQVLGAKPLTGDDHVRLSALLKVAALEVEALRAAEGAARDDAAELRAALAKMSDLVFTMLSAEDELSRAKGPGGSYPEDVAGYHAARRNAWRDLQGLAQEYDDPDALRAALAATEGES